MKNKLKFAAPPWPAATKIILVMKLIIFTLFLGLSQISAKTYSQYITLNEKNISLKRFIKLIERQSGYDFVYDHKVDLLKSNTIDVNIRNQNLDLVLEKYLSCFQISYKITRRTVALKIADGLLAANPELKVPITGSITDEKGRKLPGVTVKVKGSLKSVVTGSSGLFSIDAKPGDILVISYVGYQSKEIVVSNELTLQITLLPAITALEEMVVVGYGTQRKRDIAGSISSISSKDLSIQSASNVQNLFQGRLAGVSVSTSGIPGTPPSVRVRGIGTIGNNDPLYVIDGFPTKGNVASLINPSNVESIQVLKDAASASIYGARAANGVILITTKQGKKGKAEFNFKINSGLQSPSNLPKMLDSKQYGEVLWNAMKNAGLKPSHSQYGNGDLPVIPDYVLPAGAFEGGVDLSKYNTAENQYMRANKAGTDWEKEVYRPAQTTNLDISAQGGNEDSKYFASTNYLSQDAILKWAGYDRLSLRGNSQFMISKNVTFGESMSAVYSKYKGSTSEGDAVFQTPLLPVYDVMGNWAGTKANGLGDITNPVANLFNQKNNYNENLNFLGNLFMEISLLKSFKFKTTVGANVESSSSKTFIPKTYWNKGDKNVLVNSLNAGRNKTLELVWNNTLTYSKTFAKNSSINILLGTEALKSKSEILTASRSNFLVEDPDYLYLDAGESSKDNSGNGSEYSLFSLFSRVNYQYNDKLYLSAIVRRDGSSRFGKNNKYGYFPGVSGAWRISAEPFMAGQNIVNDLKLRASYGVTGNQEIGNYAFVSTYGTNIGDSSYPINGEVNNVIQGISKESVGNESIKWETTRQTNFGMDAAFLNNKLTFALDFYHKYTSGILQRVAYPSTAGVAAAPYVNIGEIQNIGFDFTTNYKNSSRNNEFSYDVGLILSAYRNQVKKLASNQFISGTYTRTEVGHPISSFYGYVIDGIFQNQNDVDKHASQNDKAVGRWIYRDVNGDGVVNDKDRTYIGNPHPKFEYSLNSRLNYKKFDLALYVQGTYGNDIYFASKGGQNGTDFWVDYSNKSSRILDTWTVNNRDAKLPEINILNPNNEANKVSTYFVEDGSYLRVKLLELGYTPTAKMLSKMGIKQCRFYISAENLLTVTKYNNIDPEVKNSDDLSIGIDIISNMSLAKVYSVGFNLSF